MRQSFAALRKSWPILRVAFSLAALAWVFSRIPLAEVIAVLRSARLDLLVAGVALNVATRIAAAERTQVMNHALGLSISRRQTLSTLFVSNFYSLISPGPWLSGVVTVYRYHHLGAGITGSVSSLLASRAVEAGAFLVGGLALAFLDPELRAPAARLPMLEAGAAVVVVGLALLLWRWLQRRSLPSPPPEAAPPPGAAAANAPMPGSPAAPPLRRWESAWRVARRLLQLGPGVALRASLPAALQVLGSAVALSLLAHSLGVPLSWISAGWMSAAVYLVVLLPISVAGLGVREFTLIRCFAALGLGPRGAVAVSVLLLLDLLVSGCIGAALQAATSLGRARQSASTQ
ncbi:MAG: lysylphosphatidylglycerol synthase transmembrane domain-containing protein [Steroidobacteraceae bacterium]